MMTLCDTRRELNDSYPIPRVIFKERPSPLIPSPTQSRWPIIEREAWAIIFAISLRLLTTLQPTTYRLSNATSYLILKTRLLISLPPPPVPSVLWVVELTTSPIHGKCQLWDMIFQVMQHT